MSRNKLKDHSFVLFLFVVVVVEFTHQLTLPYRPAVMAMSAQRWKLPFVMTSKAKRVKKRPKKERCIAFCIGAFKPGCWRESRTDWTREAMLCESL